MLGLNLDMRRQNNIIKECSITKYFPSYYYLICILDQDILTVHLFLHNRRIFVIVLVTYVI